MANRGSLEYVLAEIHGSLYGQELYPDLFQKAGLIAVKVIYSSDFFVSNILHLHPATRDDAAKYLRVSRNPN